MGDPIRISWSQLRAHEDCRQKSHLLRQHKRNKSQNLRSYFHGMVVDTAMREFLDDPRPGLMLERIDDLVDRVATDARESGDGIVRWKGAGDREWLVDFCKQLVTRLEPILNELVTPYPFQCGYRFKGSLRAGDTTVVLTGEMDLLVQDAGYRIWDLKGTADDTYWRKVFGQLVFYDCALQTVHQAKSVEVGLIQPMCREPVMRFTLTDDDRRQMWARILRMVSDIQHERRDCKTSTENCAWCEVKHACPRYDTLLGDSPPIDSLATAMRAAAKETQ